MPSAHSSSHANTLNSFLSLVSAAGFWHGERAPAAAEELGALQMKPKRVESHLEPGWQQTQGPEWKRDVFSERRLTWQAGSCALFVRDRVLPLAPH